MMHSFEDVRVWMDATSLDSLDEDDTPLWRGYEALMHHDVTLGVPSLLSIDFYL
jgi:hypothetical protein